MRKSPDIPTRECVRCGRKYKPHGNMQKYCDACGIEVRREYKHKHYLKNRPEPKDRKTPEPCCVCGGTFSGWFDGKPYCNKHWLRLFTHGTTEPKPRESTNTFRQEGDVLKITTRSGHEILADAYREDELRRYSWCVSKTGYAVANIGGKTVKVHRLILRDKLDGLSTVDHVNGNTLDNREENLRVCSIKENARNVRPSKWNRTGHVGISETKSGNYRVRIVADGIEHHIGTFSSIDDAIEARAKAEDEYHKEYGSHRGVGANAHGREGEET